MNFCEFAKTIFHNWKQKKTFDVQEISWKRKFKSRNRSSGHWILGRKSQRLHVRTSAILNTEPAIDYQYVDSESSELATDYFRLDFNKHEQLYRVYYDSLKYH